MILCRSAAAGGDLGGSPNLSSGVFLAMPWTVVAAAVHKMLWFGHSTTSRELGCTVEDIAPWVITLAAEIQLLQWSHIRQAT
jgi:hypothetical protein